MTVLLIDGVGRVREMELTYPAWEIRIPLERPCRIMAADEPMHVPAFPVARFQLTKEHSWPPVYRQVIDQDCMM